MKLERWDHERDGEPTEAALRAGLEALGYRVARYVYPPGTYFGEHTHSIDKIDAVVSGRFRMTVEGEEAVLEAGDRCTSPGGRPTPPRWWVTSPWSASTRPATEPDVAPTAAERGCRKRAGFLRLMGSGPLVHA